MTRFIIFSVLCLALLSGCATQEKYARILNGWVGSNERDLILNWGVPDLAYELSDNEKLLVYRESSFRVIDLNLDPKESSPYVVNYDCDTTFILVDKIVKEWKIKGNDCVAE